MKDLLYSAPVNYNSNVMLNLLQTLHNIEIKALNGLVLHMQPDTNMLIRTDGKKWLIKDLSEALKLDYDNFRKVINRLEDEDVIKKLNANIVVNPFVCFKGKTLSADLYYEFSDTKLYDASFGERFIADRKSIDCHRWVNQVIERDKHCVICGRDYNLEAHHIIPYAKAKLLRTEVTNGITLCQQHHSPMILNSFHQVYGTRNNTKEQLQTYINSERSRLGLPVILIDDIVN